MVRDLQSIISSVQHLPSTPKVIPRLAELISRDTTDLEDITDALKGDLQLTTEIIKLSNSALYATSTGAQSIDEAVAMVGMREVYRLVQMVAARSVLGSELKAYQLEKGAVLDKSLFCGLVMESLSKTRPKNYNPANSFTIGLLHAIGKIVINTFVTQGRSESFQQQFMNGFPPEVEFRLLGITNAHVAAALLEEWNFPYAITEPILHQFSPEAAQKHQMTANLLVFAKEIVEFAGSNNIYEPMIPKNEWFEFEGLTKEEFEAAIIDAQARHESIRILLL